MRAVKLCGFCLVFVGLLMTTVFAGGIQGHDVAPGLSSCDYVGLSGITLKAQGFCAQFGGEVAVRAEHNALENRVEANILAFLDARNVGDLAWRGYVEIDVITDKGVDVEARINQAFADIGHVTIGYTPSIFDLHDPLNFLSLEVAPSLPKTSDLAERHQSDAQARVFANVGFITSTIGVENLDDVIDGESPTLVAHLAASEIWGDVAIMAKYAPVGSGFGQLIALDTTFPIPLSVGTRLRLVALYANGLISYLDQPADIAEAEGWATHLSISHELDDTWAVALAGGVADSEGSDTRRSLGASLTMSPDFDTKISLGANYNWPDEHWVVGAGFTYEPIDRLVIDGSTQYEVETSDFEAALSIIQSY